MTIVIERLGHQGDGIAPGPIFAARTLPGETISGDVAANRIAAPTIVAPSPARVTPPCPHYKTCGGCDLMHASDAFVADWKVDIVRQALRAQGLDAPITGLATSPPNSRRRASLSGRRTKTGALLGFHERGSHTLSDISACRVLVPEILAGMVGFSALVSGCASRKAEVAIAVMHGPAGLDVSVTNGRTMDRALQAKLADLAAQYDFARLSFDNENIVQRRVPFIPFGRARVVPPPGAFLQATRHGEAALLASAKEAVGGARRIADLFSGCGTFALPLAEKAKVHAVESDVAMTEALMDGWRKADGLKAMTTAGRDLFRRPILASELDGYDAVVIDPPRAGAQAQFGEIAKSAVDRVASISCNPVTFARDAGILVAGGYTLDWVRVIDQFRWSAHVEVAAQLTRGHIAP